MPLLLLPLLTACGSNSPSVPVEPARIPALTPEARQPAQPSYCIPNCSIGLMRERESWQQRLTDDE